MRATLARPFLLLLLAAAGPAAAQSNDRLDAALRSAVDGGRIPGVVAMVADSERILYSGAFGARDAAAGAPMAMDTVFRIASMTKPVTSVAVVMLIEGGQVGLDDPIGRHLPELAGKEVIADFDAATGRYTTRPARGEITVRHLLTHTSGLAYGFSNETFYRLTEGTQSASAVDYPLMHDPGTRWTYGESTRVLGRLVEKVSGKGLEAFMRERIFEPLGMHDTNYRVAPENLDRVATIHRREDGRLVEAPNGNEVVSPPNGDGGLNSTAGDYIKFVQMLLRGGRAPDGTRLLSEASVALIGQNHMGDVRVELQPSMVPALSEPFPLGAGRDTYGLGFQVTGSPAEPGLRAPGSMSWAGIFNTEFWIDPANGLGAVLLMQYLPFYDAAAIDTLLEFERGVYATFADR